MAGGPDLRDRFRRALIAEDNVAIGRSLVRLVDGWGACAMLAMTLGEALEMLSPPLDLVISDVRLPDGSGLTIFERAVQLANVPLMVAVSGRASPTEAFALARIGVHAFISKPFTKSQLEKVIWEACEQRASNEPGAAAAGQDRRRGSQRALASFSTAYELSDQQTEILRLLLAGCRRKELPAALRVSENTCKTMVRRLLTRCGAKNLSEIVRELIGVGAQAADNRFATPKLDTKA